MTESKTIYIRPPNQILITKKGEESMFCSNCGTNVPDNVVNCTNCGVRMMAAPSNAGGPSFPKQKDSISPYFKKLPKSWVVIGAVAIALILIFFFGSIMMKPGYNKPIKQMIKGIEKEDADKFLEAYPEFVVDEMEDDYYYYDEDVESYFEDNIYDPLESEYGKKLRISYKIKEATKMRFSTLNSLQMSYLDGYDEDERIKEGYELDVEFKIKGDDDSVSFGTTLYVIKFESKWYCMNTPRELNELIEYIID